MDKMKKIAVLLVASLLQLAVMAQGTAPTANEDIMRSNGKIYVVVAVIVTIVAGIFLYLLNLDRKISRLEKNLPAR
jgi:multisubunit Na+/H+ antiporter MnhB subunit